MDNAKVKAAFDSLAAGVKQLGDKLAELRAALEEGAQAATNLGPTPSSRIPSGEKQGSVVYAMNLSGSKGQWKSTDWNVEPKGQSISWPPPVGEFAGRRAIKFALPSNGKRIEVEPDHKTFGGSGDAYFGFDFYLDANFPVDVNDWQVVWQLHGNDTTSPRFALQIRNNELRIGDNKKLASVVRNRWYKVVVYADFTNGLMTVWLDHAKVGDKVNVGRSNPNYYLKVGYYRNPNIGRVGTFYGSSYTLATGYGAAAQLG